MPTAIRSRPSATSRNSARSGGAALQHHRQAVSRPQGNEPDRLDSMAGLKAQAIALRHHRQDDDRLLHREAGADADARSTAERQIGVTRPRFGAARSKALVVEQL